MDIQNRLSSLQAIVNFYLKDVYSANTCKVKLHKFDNLTTMAQYRPDTNEILVREEMILRGEINVSADKSIQMFDPASQIFFYVTHEIKHAAQEHMLNNRHLHQGHRMLNLYICNQRCIGELNSYFQNNPMRNLHFADLSHMIYMLQPRERNAFEFAHQELDSLLKELHLRFPEECKIYSHDLYSDFNEIKNTAHELLQSTDPMQDIDDILLAINGYDVSRQLNKQICQVINETQDLSICKRLKEYQDSLKARTDKDNVHFNEIGTDVSDCFQEFQNRS
jgi:hypothetical protein